MLDTAAFLQEQPLERHDGMDLPLDYVRLENTDAIVRFGQAHHAQALVHMVHPVGGRMALHLGPATMA